MMIWLMKECLPRFKFIFFCSCNSRPAGIINGTADAMLLQSF